MSQERAVSVTLDYVLLLAVAVTVMVSMVILVGGLVDSQQTHAVEDELRVTGESFASELESVDRLIEQGENITEFRYERDLPRTINGDRYEFEIDNESLILRLQDGSSTVTIDLQAESVEETAPIRGGPVEIILSEGSLEVRSR